MPPSPRRRAEQQAAGTTNPEATTERDPDTIRPYKHHGLVLTVREGGRQQVCDCPVCGSSGKFTIEVATSKFRCFACAVTGNSVGFIRLLHEVSVKRTTQAFLEEVIKDRGLTEVSTVTAWGVCRSTIPPHHWLVPGYNLKGEITQLYKRTKIRGSDGVYSWRLIPTPGLYPDPGKSHALFLPIGDFNPSRERVDVMEGIWDAMAYWEVVQSTEAAGDSNVVGVPGANVWRDDWTALCRKKDVTLWFDSDYPRKVEGVKGEKVTQPGWDGMRRVCKKLSGHALSVSVVKWGPEGYDPTRKDGWDVRDALSSSPDRLGALADLVSLVDEAPKDWFSATKKDTAATSNGKVPHATIEAESCETWDHCLSAWKDALEWRTELSQVLLSMLAVAASTNQSGENQLFLRVIGDPGSAKTRLCKGLLVSKHCKLLLHLKSFHSGFLKPGEDGGDCSLVSRISGMCLVTPEADALTLRGNAEELDSQARQIFDGESANSYANTDEDRHYRGLRSPWIQAGTPALMDKDQSRLGDRFLRIRIEQPEEAVKRSILLKAFRNERSAVLETANGTEGSIVPPKLRKAYALTGGYVNWLRANVEDKLPEIEASISDDVEQECLDLGVLAAEMRARPNVDPKKVETFPTKELPTRLVCQLGRLAMHLAVAMNKTEIDREVMNVVRKVAIDTAHGHTMNIVMLLCTRNPGNPQLSYQRSGGLGESTIQRLCNMTAERTMNYLSFLRKIDVVKLLTASKSGGNYWALTERVYELYLRVMSR